MPKKRRGSSVSIDWSKAELQNRLAREGTYLFRVTGAEEGDNDNIVIDAEVISDKQEGKALRQYFGTQPQALWKLAQFLEACGVEIPDDEADLDLDELIDKEFGGRVETHDYNDKTYYRVKEFMTADDFEEDSGGKSKPAAKPSKEEEPDEKTEKRGRGRPKGSTNKSKEEPKKPKLPKMTAEDIQGMNEEELEEVVDKYNLKDVDLDDAKTLRKKAALVLDALETAEMLEE